ncbi:DUF2017 domain-containing protein [Pseudokineococcus lusitanus]|uniref:Uncharacterized protein DUF2017 n=1 Tax=Pseudokineococcus lusitanus TaxID=763993 RepID=A0A3N1HU47_9ACTN|nr:DUF2017 domain-containing protein [Pseudokineococcus lusitanus]ROP45989.1 uncharacterized protein DUF2017 [Pseudokineococcus lusitanus]
MARRFRRTRRGVTAGLEPGEVELLVGLFEDVAGMLDEAAGAGPDAADGAVPADPLAALERQLTAEPPGPPQDPAVARLLPPASTDDDEAASDFRRFTQEGLAARKQQGLRRAAATLRRPAPLLLDDHEAQAWVRALTDVRLVLAARLGLETDDDAALVALRAEEADADDPVAWTAGVYDFLTWMQEGLTDVLLDALPAEGRRGRGTGRG